MKYLKLILPLLFVCNLNAQRLTKAQVDSLPNTIENQFTKAYRLSNTWQDYKMIKRSYFVSFQKSILDSVTGLKKNIATKQQKINEQQTTITSLNERISSLNGNLSTAISKENNIFLFGIPMSKASYNILLWSIIAGLIAGLAFFVYKFKSSNLLTREAKDSLAEIELEFEQHRKKAIEKEQKLRRQLQDEINKQRGV